MVTLRNPEYFSAKLDGVIEFWEAVPDMVKRYGELTPEARMEFFGVDYQIAGDQERQLDQAQADTALDPEHERRLAGVKRLRERYEPDVLRIRDAS